MSKFLPADDIKNQYTLSTFFLKVNIFAVPLEKQSKQ